MADGISHRFAEFFEAVWGFPPFAWQAELAQRVLTNPDAPWPQAIALATAAGKTACIDIAVFALAEQAHRLTRGERITAPRRIFFVVDRRVIVDEAFERSRTLAERLNQANAGILFEVAGQLRKLAAGTTEGIGDEPGLTADALQAFELRGGMYRSEAWARSPLQPMVVASTVDQFGSRLLFRAYGRGPGMWPVYAGLTGNDSLVLLDEAHCAKPFLQTLRAVARYRTWAEQPLQAPFYPVVLSATPPEEAADDVFRDESDQPRDPTHPLGQRQLARKPAHLVELNLTAKQRPTKLPLALKEHAEALAAGPRKAVVIFCNRVATARSTHRALRKAHQHCVLLTGRMRSLDKDRVVTEQLLELASNRAAQRRLTEPLFVVATQTLEVGADLDFDALVTECASLDALRQRFGRLNRTGRAIDGTNDGGHPVGAQAVIIGCTDQVTPGADDPVYGEAIGGTWRELIKLADEDGVVDLGISHLNAGALPSDPTENTVIAPSLDAPVMLPSHIDAWVQTSPEPAPVPEPALFLHGPERASADVRVCWRADIALETDQAVEQAIAALTQIPPAAPETLPVPIGVMRRWLTGEARDDSADVLGTGDADSPDDPTQDGPGGIARRVLRWIGGTGETTRIANPRDIRPGDTLVIPARTGDAEAPGDLLAGDDGKPRLDLGDEASLRARAKAALRLHPALIETWPLSDEALRGRWRALATNGANRLDDEPETLINELHTLLADTVARPDAMAEDWLRHTLEHFSNYAARRLKPLLLRHPSMTGLVLLGRKLLPEYMNGAERFTDEDDASASGTGEVPLLPVDGDDTAAVPEAHLPGVARYARRFATGCGLPDDLAATVERAALLHDLGKLDPRFQCLLAAGNCWSVDPDNPLAKSSRIPRDRAAWERARGAADYPRGARHELYSVVLAESDDTGTLLPEQEAKRSLILHLIASHHGHCRPFAPISDDPGPAVPINARLLGVELTHGAEPTRLERLDSGIPERFWQQVRRYGWWGCAWLEAILRLADHRRSESEERRGQ
jgi:CRISPR-associated endonuclease/helicase Cas3